MDANWLRLAMMAIGGMSLYTGYRLFCDVPRAQNGRGTMLRNFVAGALLAVAGLGIMFTEARALAAHSRVGVAGWNRHRPTERGSYDAPRPHHEARVERSV